MTSKDDNKHKILILISNFLPGNKMGGPLNSILNLINNLSDNYSFEILTSDRDNGDKMPYKNIQLNEWLNKGNYEICYLKSNVFSLFRLAKYINKSNADVLYVNSMLNPVFSVWVVFLNRLGILRKKKLILAPRGETFSEALRIKKNKKNLYIWFAKKFHLYKNVYWHASSEDEKFSIVKNIKIDSEKIYVALNLTSKVNEGITVAKESIIKKSDNLYIVFLGRISKQKNILYAFEILKNLHINVVFHIYGNIEDKALWEKCENEISKLPNNINAEYKGFISNDSSKNILEQYDLLFLPSFSENFGHVIAEALSVGTPVLISDKTPWKNLISQGYGWDLSLNFPEKFVQAIEYMASLSADDKIKKRLEIKNNIAHYLNSPEIIEANRNIFSSQPIQPMRYTRDYQICTKTIMDTSDPNIVFDEYGISDYYHNFQNNILPNWHTDERGLRELMQVAENIKKENKKKDFDCIIGLSGGLDSSYTAYIAKEVMGLRPLLFHVDAGWNTDKAVGNIEKLCNGLGLDLYTNVINWEEMKDLQVAFLKSQIADQDLPQDYAFFSGLYQFAKKNKIKYVLTGGNYSTECCREPEEWGGFPGIDTMLVKDIHSKFGKRPLKTFLLVDILTYKLYYRYILGVHVFKPLNLIPYIKSDAENLLIERYGWQPFQHKHHESRFTRFYEDYWLPRKFGFEKRRAHFSSLILTGQMTRDEALERISKPEMSDDFLEKEFVFIAEKLDITEGELREIFNGENKTFHDYKNKIKLINFGSKVMKSIGLEKRLFR